MDSWCRLGGCLRFCWFYANMADRRYIGAERCWWSDICVLFIAVSSSSPEKVEELAYSCIQKHSRFRVKSFENNPTFISRGVIVRVATFYRLHPTKTKKKKKRTERWIFLQRMFLVCWLCSRQQWTSVDPWIFQCSLGFTRGHKYQVSLWNSQAIQSHSACV